MTYDLEQLRDIINNKRSLFKTATVLSSVFFVLGILVAVFWDGVTPRFVGVAASVLSVIHYLSYLRRCPPSVIFRGELRGINVKEHEFVPLGGQRRGIYRYTGMQRANPSVVHPRGIHAELYLKDEAGEIHAVTGLSKLHTDIYEDGDELLRPAGCIYPIIVGRRVEKQPCPLCGRINSEADKKCPVCGLDIIVK